MLQVRLGQAIVARASQPHTTHSLGVRGFNAGTRGILLPKLWGLLLGSSPLQGLITGLRTQMDDPASCGGAGTVGATGTGRTGLLREPGFDAAGLHRPVDTALALWTGHLLPLPVDLKVGQVEALACFGLPTGVG